MPSSSEILAGLQRIANDWRVLAIAWHAALGLLLVSLISGWRPGKRIAGILLAAPLVSVSAMAWRSGNPFNGVVFSALSLCLIPVVVALPDDHVRVGAPWAVAAGAMLTAFAWFYPHFVESRSWIAYAYASPLGLIPCPTLSAVAGLTLILDGLGSRAWPLIVVAAGVLYGVVGLLRLGVVIDAVLLAGVVALAVATFKPDTRR